jgi:hypothetical protein
MNVPTENKTTDFEDIKAENKPVETTTPPDSTVKESPKDLLQMLQEATEKKPDPNLQQKKQPEGSAEIKEQISDPTPDINNFRPPGVSDPVPDKSAYKMPYHDQAELLIAFVDGLDCLILPWGYQKSIFNADERKRLKEIKAIKESKSLNAFKELNDTDKELLSRYNDYKELSAAIPFTKQEIEITKTPLAALLEKYKSNLGPETLFFGALFTLMAPRLMPLFNKFERL